MTKKLYFSELDEVRAYTLDYIIEEAIEEGLTELTVHEAEKDTDNNHFFCKAVGEVCVKPPEGEPCGNECDIYKPRNGKSGCCKYYRSCYTEGKELILNVETGKLTSKP